MNNFHIKLPKGFQVLDDVLYKILASKSALQVDLIDPSFYQISIQNQTSCPTGGIKVIGQSALNSDKSAIRCKSGNIFLPLMMKIETVRLSHQCILSMKIDEDHRKWISTNLFRALLTGCKLEVWDKRDHEISFLNHKAAIDFSRLFAWNLYPYTDTEMWKRASWFQLIEISTHTAISLYSRPAIRKQQREANRMMRQLDDTQAHKAGKTISERSTQISQLILANS
jgi:hypothetical protein